MEQPVAIYIDSRDFQWRLLLSANDTQMQTVIRDAGLQARPGPTEMGGMEG
jgi:hypothetical protein